MAKKKTIQLEPYAWLIAYVDIGNLDRFWNDLKKLSKDMGLPTSQIDVYIPTVRILKKRFKGVAHFETVPFLLNYGFFRVPRKYAQFKQFLDAMKRNVSCINGWVYDMTKEVTTKHDDIHGDVELYGDNQIPCATATDEDILRIKDSAYYSSIYSADDIEDLLARKGKVVTLMGYPFDNMLATVEEVNVKKQEVIVTLPLMSNAHQRVKLHFDNVLFTIYHNKSYDDTVTLAQSLNMMEEGSKLDKATAK